MVTDLLFDFDFFESEKLVSDKEGSYVGLSQEALLTSLEDYKAIFKEFPKALTYVELGSAYGLGPLLFTAMYPDSTSLGIEFESARFEQAMKMREKLRSSRTDFILSDLLHCDIPQADLYFLYFPTGPVLDRLLNVLGSLPHLFHLVVIESHGDLFPRLAKENWLSEVFEIPLHSLRHYPAAKVFTKNAQKNASLHDFSFKSFYFLIRQSEDHFWIGDSYGLEWLKAGAFNLKYPPCTIEERNIVQVLKWEELDPLLRKLIRLRNQNEIFYSRQNPHTAGLIRKIFIRPEIKIELSTGQMVLLDEIIDQIGIVYDDF